MTNISIDLLDTLSLVIWRPTEIMKELGITYKRAEGVSHTDTMHFYDCDNIPETLPPYVHVWEPGGMRTTPKQGSSNG